MILKETITVYLETEFDYTITTGPIRKQDLGALIG